MKNKKILQKYQSSSSKLKRIINKIWDTQKVHIGGVINYKNFNSNIIKFFSQSIYSHINFFDPQTKTAIGAENLDTVTIKNYKNNKTGNFYYTSKQIDLDYIGFIFQFEHVESIFQTLEKYDPDKTNYTIKDKFIIYCQIQQEYSQINLEKLLNIEKNDINIKNEYKQKVNKFLNIKENLKKGQIKDFDKKLYDTYFKYLKQFLILGIIKFIIINYNKKYDLSGTLSSTTSPRSPVDHNDKNYFCSEFISGALLYAGIYPFDISTKDPASITPGDLMDSNMLFEEKQTKLYKITKQKPYIQKITSVQNNKFIKNYILNKNQTKLDFNKSKIYINLLNNVFKISEMIITNKNKKTISRKKTYFKLPVYGLIFTLIGYTIGNLEKIGLQASISKNIDTINQSLPLLEFFIQGITIAIQIAFVIFILRLLIPFIVTIIKKIDKLLGKAMFDF